MKGFRKKQTMKSFAIVCVAVIVFLMIVVLEPRAYADDDENLVNPQQLPDSSFIYDTSITDLSTADPFYDKQTVQVVGEVVGDSLQPRPHSSRRWITLTTTEAESNASVLVNMSQSDAEKIDAFGKYGVTGTLLQVRGTFNLACSEHEGVTDIHAEHVTVVASSKSDESHFDLVTFAPGVILVIIGLIAMLIYYRMRERRR